MLEFIFSFIEHNIFLIFLCVLILGIVSVFSKGTKILFLFLLGTASAYFALLCLYRLGIGIECLYEWSSKWVILICTYLDQYGMIFVHSENIFLRLVHYFLMRGYENAMTQFIYILFTVVSIYIAVKIFSFYVRGYFLKKIEMKEKKIIKTTKSINTIKENQPKFLLNLVIRC